MQPAPGRSRRLVVWAAAFVVTLMGVAPAAGQFNIVINAGPTLQANAPALAAFERAATRWENRFTDPITITIDADLAPLGAGTLGGAEPRIFGTDFTTVRNAMVADAANEPTTNAIVAFLPTAAQFTATRPSGVTLDGRLSGTKANLKALGFDLDGLLGAGDGTITFGTDVAFDYDNGDGVTGGLTDFETAATREIGRILGFVSTVDAIDGGSTQVGPMTPDLFRFDRTGATPSNGAEFATFARDLRPGGDTVFDDTTTEYRLSTGVSQGDGNPAGYWKADELTGLTIGVMDPTLAPGEFVFPSEADFRVLDLIGYELTPVPEPAGVLAAVTGLAAGWAVRRRRAAAV